MDVIGYMHNADLLLEDEQGVAIIGGGNYVLSIGDKVILRQKLENESQRYLVDITFASNQHQSVCQDEWCVKFIGDRAELQQYKSLTTVH